MLGIIARFLHIYLAAKDINNNLALIQKKSRKELNTLIEFLSNIIDHVKTNPDQVNYDLTKELCEEIYSIKEIACSYNCFIRNFYCKDKDYDYNIIIILMQCEIEYGKVAEECMQEQVTIQ